MSDKDIQILIQLAEQKLQQPVTQQQALRSLIDAGLIDQQGNPTQPYLDLANEQ